MSETPDDRPWEPFISKPTIMWLMSLSAGLFSGVLIGCFWAGSGRGFDPASARLAEALSKLSTFALALPIRRRSLMAVDCLAYSPIRRQLQASLGYDS